MNKEEFIKKFHSDYSQAPLEKEEAEKITTMTEEVVQGCAKEEGVKLTLLESRMIAYDMMIGVQESVLNQYKAVRDEFMELNNIKKD